MHGSTGGGWKRSVGHGTREMSAGRETAGEAPGPTAKRHRASPRPYISRVILAWDGVGRAVAEGSGLWTRGTADALVEVSGVLVAGGLGWAASSGGGARKGLEAGECCGQGVSPGPPGVDPEEQPAPSAGEPELPNQRKGRV